MVLRVPIEGDAWLVDVGFGGFGLLEPIHLREGARSDQGGATYALRREGGAWVLSMRDRVGDHDLYDFTEDPQTPADIEVANHYTSTHPSSMFRRVLTIQRTTREERTIMRSDVIVRFRSGLSTEEPIDRSRLRVVVRDLFGIELPTTPLVFESDEAHA
jgi:N-hydroxyarylamine O-acetyltransferase